MMKRLNSDFIGIWKNLSYKYKNKKQAMTIAYAIVLLVIVAVIIAGLTPVLTRKLPNLSTSTTIKHPRGWYESFNAPDEKVRYCSKCKENDESKKPWPQPIVYDKETKIGDVCYGNPSCLPYIDPNTDSKKIVPFDRYCKPSGKCGATNKCGEKCRFNPPKGISKYVVYAVGGGGGSGSAVAENLNDTDKVQYKKTVIGRNNKTGSDTYSSDNLPMVAGTVSEPNMINADFIDMNRKDTVHATYTPNDFAKSSNLYTYPNKLKRGITPKCATGIFYTTGKENINFHIYPTEDSDPRLAKGVSDKQMVRILKEQNKSENDTYDDPPKLLYKNRYYLYTKQLGAYNFNQNPEYAIMPEWVKVTGQEHAYPDNPDTKVIDSSSGKYCSENDCFNNPKDGCFAKPANEPKDENHNICLINYPLLGGTSKNGDYITPITSVYKTAATVACSGDGGSGGDVTLSAGAGTKACLWMWPNACPFDMDKNYKNGIAYTKTDEHAYNLSDCTTRCKGYLEPPPNGSTSIYYCFNGSTLSKHNGVCYNKECSYFNQFKNRKCIYDPFQNDLVKCTCPTDTDVLKPRCKDQNDVIEKCAPEVIKISAGNPTASSDQRNFKDHTEKNATDVIDSGFEYSDNSSSVVFNLDENGNVYDISNPKNSVYVGRIGSPKDDGNGNKTYTDAQLSRLDGIMVNWFKKDKDSDAEIQRKLIKHTGGGVPACNFIRPYSRSAYGGAKGNGICAYKTASIKPNAIYEITTGGYTKNEPKAPKASICDQGIKGKTAGNVTVCINNICVDATGGGGGQAASFDCTGELGGLCTGKGHNGQKGADGKVMRGHNPAGGSFPKNEIGNPALQYKNDGAYVDTSSRVPRDSQVASPGGAVNDNIAGTQKLPGIYNYRYIWYMPFITKHLMFGTAGDTGEEIISTVTLSEGQTLTVVPGKGAISSTEHYKSGENGKAGENSTVEDSLSNEIFVAHGGKGGIGSQKSDEYVLCHISDLQGVSPELPCYAKRISENELDTNYKKTHYFDSNNTFVGIKAIQAKVGIKGVPVKMSKELKNSNPGRGGMGYGTESVSDFICEQRRVDKFDEVADYNHTSRTYSTMGPKKTDTVIRSGGQASPNCNGNSKIKYILPNAKDYASSTGAVIVIW